MITSRRALPVLGVLLAATPALAQPGAEELLPPPPAGGTVVVIQPEPGPGTQAPAVRAPMNEDWNNVSHINGLPVKVGERGDYLMTYKKTNISSNPIGWMFGFYGLSVSHALSPNVAVRADGNFFSFEHDSGYELGLTVPIYFKRVYQGPFLEGGLMVRQFDGQECDWEGNCMPTSAKVGPQVLFGWHATFDSGWNVAAAFGAFRPMRDGKTSKEVEPAGYFRVGYAY